MIIRQFEEISKSLKLGNLSITDVALNIGLIDKKGNPTKYAFEINKKRLLKDYGQLFLFDIESFNQMCDCERIRTAIQCYFMALPGIPNARMESIGEQIRRCSKRVPIEKSLKALLMILKHTEKRLLEDEHYEDLNIWKNVKSFILSEAEKTYGKKLIIE